MLGHDDEECYDVEKEREYGVVILLVEVRGDEVCVAVVETLALKSAVAVTHVVDCNPAGPLTGCGVMSPNLNFDVGVIAVDVLQMQHFDGVLSYGENPVTPDDVGPCLGCVVHVDSCIAAYQETDGRSRNVLNGPYVHARSPV